MLNTTRFQNFNMISTFLLLSESLKLFGNQKWNVWKLNIYFNFYQIIFKIFTNYLRSYYSGPMARLTINQKVSQVGANSVSIFPLVTLFRILCLLNHQKRFRCFGSSAFRHIFTNNQSSATKRQSCLLPRAFWPFKEPKKVN